MRLRTCLWSSMLAGLFAVTALYAGERPIDVGETPLPRCPYENYQRSCGALHANTGRVCGTGANAVPCGDIIVLDTNVNDVRSGTTAIGPIDFPCGSPASVQIHFWACVGGACQNQGIAKRTCQGRCARGCAER